MNLSQKETAPLLGERKETAPLLGERRETAPLLGERRVTYEGDSELEGLGYESSSSLGFCRSNRYSEPGSDAEYLSRPESSRSRTLPNNAPIPYVYLGFSCAVLAGICFTSSNVMVKYIPDVNSWQLLFVRCVSQMTTMIPIIWWTKSPIFGTPDFGTRWRIAAQGILGGLLLLAIFEAVARLPLGDCTAIFFSSPAFTMILSFFILKDHCGVWRSLVSIILLLGVIILSRPPALFPESEQPANFNHSTHHTHNHTNHLESNHTNHYERNHTNHADAEDGNYSMIGLLSALAVPTLSAWIVIITRQAKHVHYSVLVFWFAVGGFIVSLLGIFAFDCQPMFHDWGIRIWMLSLMVALVGILGSILMTKAVCWVTPSKVMVVRSFEVVAAYILQVTVFDVPTHWTDLSGTICVIGAVLMMGVEDCVMERFEYRFL